MDVFTIKGETRESTVTPIRIISRKALSLKWLPRTDSGWESGRQWKTFCCGRPVCPSESVMLVKINENDRTSTNLGLVQHIGGSIWSIGKLDKSVRIKDIKAIVEHEELSLSPALDGMNVKKEEPDAQQPFTIGILENFFSKCALEPQWPTPGGNSSRKLLLTPPDSKRNTSPTKKIAPVLVEERDPVKFMKSRYLQSLYDPKELLVYFAKSVMSKIRSQCRETYPDDKQKYARATTSVFWGRVSDWCTLDQRYDELWPAELDAEEKEHRANWHEGLTPREKTNLTASLRDLKARETQLKIIILLEMLAMERKYGRSASERINDRGSDENKSKSKPAVGLVRKKRRKANTQKPASKTDSTDSEPNIAREGLSVCDIVEMLFDRLCIWQSVSQELAAVTGGEEKTAVGGHAGAPGAGSAKDKVLQFCLEIVLPFYGSRLPEKTKTLVKKARGLSARALRQNNISGVANAPFPSQSAGKEEPSAPKQGQSEESQAFSSGKPGDETQTSRLATKTHSRGGIQVAKSTQQQRRQVEVSFSAAPIRREQLQEELETAIKAVSKPNRMLATREMCGLRKPPLPPARSRSQPIIHVAATPSGRRSIVLNEFTDNRTNEVIETPPKRPVASSATIHTPATHAEPGTIVSSSPLAIRTPSTGSKRTAGTAFLPLPVSPIARRKLNLTASRAPVSSAIEDVTK